MTRATVQRDGPTWAITVTGTGLPSLALARVLRALDDVHDREDGLTVTSVVPVASAARGPRVIRRPR